MKNLLIKLGLWEENASMPAIRHDLSKHEIVDTDWYLEACKHYCGKCNRWFEKYVGKLMHDRHRHKNEEMA